MYTFPACRFAFWVRRLGVMSCLTRPGPQCCRFIVNIFTWYASNWIFLNFLLDSSLGNISHILIHWASKETYHFFRATLTKIHCIKIDNIQTQISYNSHYDTHQKNFKISFAIKEKNVTKLLKVTFQKSQKLLAENLRERPPIQNISIAIHPISKGGYCNCRTGYCPYRAPCLGGEQFLWFFKHDLLRFYLILFFFDSSKRKHF